MINTLYEIDQKIHDFCDKSAIINEFNDDKFAADFTSSNHNYPLLWATPTRMRIANGQVSFITQITVMDIMYEKSNLIKTLSDLAIILTELLAYIDDDSDNFMYYSVVAGDFLPFSQDIDGCSGWQGEIEFRLKYEVESQNIRFK